MFIFNVFNFLLMWMLISFLLFNSFNMVSVTFTNVNKIMIKSMGLKGTNGIVSYLLFYFIFFSALGGFISYSLMVLNMFQVVMLVSLICWLSSFMYFVSNLGVQHYFTKGGGSSSKSMLLAIIEVVSDITRPISLTIRLYINMWIGHLLFSMMAVSYEYFYWSLLLYMLLIPMELFVFVAQAFIFSRLMYMYMGA